MNATTKDSINHWTRPLRFLLVYGLAVAMIFFALPTLAGQLEALYESISIPVRFAVVLVFVGGIGAWQFRNMRQTTKD